MSYEGYRKLLCSAGHLWKVDAFDDDGMCPVCQGSPVWSNAVDETNGAEQAEDGIFYYPTEVKLDAATEAVYQHCDHCGVTSLLTPPTYKIPKRE